MDLHLDSMSNSLFQQVSAVTHFAPDSTVWFTLRQIVRTALTLCSTEDSCDSHCAIYLRPVLVNSQTTKAQSEYPLRDRKKTKLPVLIHNWELV